jgi:hypothetical protein
MALAITPLPLPVSPLSMMVVSLDATFSTMRRIRFMEGLWPMISLNAVWDGGPMGMILVGVGLEPVMESVSRACASVDLWMAFPAFF